MKLYHQYNTLYNRSRYWLLNILKPAHKTFSELSASAPTRNMGQSSHLLSILLRLQSILLFIFKKRKMKTLKLSLDYPLSLEICKQNNP